VFSDESGLKLRPAVVVSASSYHRAREEMIVSASTSNVQRRLYGDHRIADWKAAGLLFPSVATGILRTIKETMAVRKLGSLSKPDLGAMDQQLRRCLGLEYSRPTT
jgi:mRNA interferase MazF